jgi:hypothetical protein
LGAETALAETGADKGMDCTEDVGAALA